ncbi:uncharacterized protein LOC144628918 [Oculina patagonica]
METLPFLLVALLALCLMPSAMALKCAACSNVPGITLGSKCGIEEDESITCGGLTDRCMTIMGVLNDTKLFMNYTKLVTIELKNCSSSIVCDPYSPLSMCNIMNITGVMVKCNTVCCEGDMCNGQGSGAARISGLLASFAAILLALVLNL